MSIIWFIIILAALIIVHEFGHFIVAKATNMRVDEFGIGFPPRALRITKKGETEYTLNWLPIGGFVKIFGENYDEETPEADQGRRFTDKPRHQQALVLVAGVTFNMVFAWLLISLGFMIGLPTPMGAADGQVQDPNLVIRSVMEESPAQEAGVKVGDSITRIEAGDDAITDPDPDAVSAFIASHSDTELDVTVSRGEEAHVFSITPSADLVEDKPAIGVSMQMIGTLQLAPHQALWRGFVTTGELTVTIARGLGQFLWRAVSGQANYANVAGPVGIVGLVGDASTLGYIYLLQFTAFISINLAIINMIPFPALDGGRLLFVGIESIKRSPINPNVANILNTIGFALLIVLMVAVTYNDILKLL